MGKPVKYISKEQLDTLYVHTNKSGLEVAQLLGIGRTTLSRKLKLYGIPEKTISEVRSQKLWHPSENQKRKLSELGRSQTGANSPSWKEGRSWTGRKASPYPIVLIDGKYIKEHRYVMEQHLGRKLLRTEEVHHRDGNKFNNEVENLQIMSKSEHSKLHWSKPERRQLQSEKIKTARASKYWSSR